MFTLYILILFVFIYSGTIAISLGLTFCFIEYLVGICRYEIYDYIIVILPLYLLFFMRGIYGLFLYGLPLMSINESY